MASQVHSVQRLQVHFHGLAQLHWHAAPLHSPAGCVWLPAHMTVHLQGRAVRKGLRLSSWQAAANCREMLSQQVHLACLAGLHADRPCSTPPIMQLRVGEHAGLHSTQHNSACAPSLWGGCPAGLSRLAPAQRAADCCSASARPPAAAPAKRPLCRCSEQQAQSMLLRGSRPHPCFTIHHACLDGLLPSPAPALLDSACASAQQSASQALP